MDNDCKMRSNIDNICKILSLNQIVKCSKIGQMWSKNGQMWSTNCQMRSKIFKFGQNGQIMSKMVKCGASLTTYVIHCCHIKLKYGEIKSKHCQIWPKMVKFGQQIVKLVQIRPKKVKYGQKMVQLGQILSHLVKH